MKTKLVLANTNDINVLSWIYNDSIPYEIKERRTGDIVRYHGIGRLHSKSCTGN